MIEVKLLILAILSDVKNHWNVYILGVILLGLFTVAPMLMLVYLRPSVVSYLRYSMYCHEYSRVDTDKYFNGD